ncbi:S1 family peptidase [Thioclava sp. IC9]|uniref:trypsin-like serine peptidase n=1 Tax=Thioclava sp. IC9 TaxID=1973007 RepID=UPI000B53D4A1|nr:S1 family peptidase [Thioclava sp. IC9]OWY01344.1 trypsin [Thioclava sp. IC9]
MRLLALALACLTAVPVLARAETITHATPLRALETGDDTRGWQAVGRLDLGHGSFCTGTLIAPDLVLTAGHCLYDKRSGALIDAREIEFLAGWRNGRAEAYRKVSRAVLHPSYHYGGPVGVKRSEFDLALIKLAQPIRLPQLQPFEVSRSAPYRGEKVGVLSYAQGRSEAPSLQRNCSVLERAGATVVMSCSADFGASGSPVFSFANGRPEIVSVVSAKAEMGTRPVSIGALANGVADLRQAIESRDNVATTREIRAGGAKFIKAN